MNKSELIKNFSLSTDLPIEDATSIINVFIDTIKDSLREGNRVEIRGFGSFQMKNYQGYLGRNPKTGATVEVKAKRVPFFRPGKELKELINNTSTTGE
ncbi:MAG: integration host factor subunit beta [Desulfovibrio sp.]|nr:integration host factor subunit beta [Desulfovibrio sp.]